ncbi:putative uroporphyrinogen-III C-methyltransferase [Andreprevotia sp. IGB-42]|uniref:uroporphyrinogen-III C-methyltransferase n=1 Tax=Andreprevotia sp. IGB-42 TaxID=2497473 RepID=UPI001357A3BD|nr:uroporphyrinogen-III C-methyltransferase [Andreprevotia sp. IGB-42]KAF0812497.1 putative uroporphyrinogen-III C-methyltransferase [Andreprevotia sp. IGB-42]
MTLEASLSAAIAPKPAPARKTLSLPLILSLVALAAAGALAWQQHRINKDLRQTYTQQGTLLQHAQGREQAAHEQLQALQREVALLGAKQAEAQNQQATLSAMYDSVTRSDSQRILLEAEQALTYASQQLQLSGRSDVALSTLAALDSQLLSLNRPELINVRKAISQDFEALKAMPVVDTVGIAARLDSLIDELDAIPLHIDNQRDPRAERVVPTEGNVLQRFASEVWGELKQLIQIRRMDRADSVLLTPEQTLLLRENMKLRLLDARSAVIARNPPIYRADLAAVGQYLGRYFDPQAPQTKHVREVLQTLQKADIAPSVQDLSSSLNAVRNARSAALKVKP